MTHISVHPFPRRIAVICTACDINHEYLTYKEARDRCKEHDLWTHPEAIQWVQ